MLTRNQQNRSNVGSCNALALRLCHQLRRPSALRIPFRCSCSTISYVLCAPAQYRPLCPTVNCECCPTGRLPVVQLTLDSRVVIPKLWKSYKNSSYLRSNSWRHATLNSYLLPDGYAATDSRRPRPNAANGTFDIVTTECRRPDGCGACDNVARNSASFGDGPSPPRSESLRTWLAVMPISIGESRKCIQNIKIGINWICVTEQGTDHRSLVAMAANASAVDPSMATANMGSLAILCQDCLEGSTFCWAPAIQLLRRYSTLRRQFWSHPDWTRVWTMIFAADWNALQILVKREQEQQRDVINCVHSLCFISCVLWASLSSTSLLVRASSRKWNKSFVR